MVYSRKLHPLCIIDITGEEYRTLFRTDKLELRIPAPLSKVGYGNQQMSSQPCAKNIIIHAVWAYDPAGGKVLFPVTDDETGILQRARVGR